MFKYYKKSLIMLIFIDIWFIVAAMVFLIKFSDTEIVGILMVASLVISIFLFRTMKYNIVLSKYENAMQQKDYIKADLVLTKYMTKYKWLAVLKINLMLVRGEIEQYLFAYNTFNYTIISKKEFRYYAFLLLVYKEYYDLLSNNKIDFEKINNIKNIKKSYVPNIFHISIKLLSENDFASAKKVMISNGMIGLLGGDFIQFINAYIFYLCAKGEKEDIKNYLLVLNQLAYDEFLKKIVSKLQ